MYVSVCVRYVCWCMATNEYRRSCWCLCMCVYVLCICVCVCLCMFACVYVCVRVCVCLSIIIDACMAVCIRYMSSDIEPSINIKYRIHGDKLTNNRRLCGSYILLIKQVTGHDTLTQSSSSLHAGIGRLLIIRVELHSLAYYCLVQQLALQGFSLKGQFNVSPTLSIEVH